MVAKIVWRVLGVAGIVVLATTGCVRAKPERTLPAVEQVFGPAEPEALVVSTPTEPPATEVPTAIAIDTATTAPTWTPTPETPPTWPPTSTPVRATPVPTATNTPTLQPPVASPTPIPTATAEPTMPVTVTPSPTATLAATRSTAGLVSYEVQGGDTLYSLAVLHGTTVVALLEANGIAEIAPLKVGQLIWLPADAAPYSGPLIQTTNYWARRGETLAGIARRYKTAVAEILAANPSLSEKDPLYTGQYLIVPVNTVR